MHVLRTGRPGAVGPLAFRSVPTATTPDQRARSADRLFWVGAAALVLGLVVVLVAVLTPSDLFVVVGGMVPRWWPVELVLVVGGLGLLLASVCRRSPNPTDTVGPRPLMPTRVLRWVTGLLVTALVGLSVVGLGVVGLVRSGTAYHVLAPQSVAGCRVVVAERSFLLAGSGTVYVLPAGRLVPAAVGSYVADDGYRPISGGTFRVEWAGETARLTLWGEPGRNVGYDESSLCE